MAIFMNWIFDLLDFDDTSNDNAEYVEAIAPGGWSMW